MLCALKRESNGEMRIPLYLPLRRRREIQTGLTELTFIGQHKEGAQSLVRTEFAPTMVKGMTNWLSL